MTLLLRHPLFGPAALRLDATKKNKNEQKPADRPIEREAGIAEEAAGGERPEVVSGSGCCVVLFYFLGDFVCVSLSPLLRCFVLQLGMYVHGYLVVRPHLDLVRALDAYYCSFARVQTCKLFERLPNVSIGGEHGLCPQQKHPGTPAAARHPLCSAVF